MHIFDPKIPNNTMPKLPLALDFTDTKLLIQLNKTNIALGRLNTEAQAIPNKRILIEFASIKESVSSNAIENIHTTIEEAFVAELAHDRNTLTQANKETLHYKDAIIQWSKTIRENGVLFVKDIVDLNVLLLGNEQWILSSPNKHIMKWEEIIYTPPLWMDVIMDFLSNFEQYFNTFSLENEIDPLLKLPMLHYQFEAIHPFWDGNGRIGRILAVLFLYLHHKLDSPILFLSESIIRNKDQYYRFLYAIDRGEEWSLHAFTLRFLSLVETQSIITSIIIKDIQILMFEIKQKLKNKNHPKLNKIYSQELLNYLFTRPYYDVVWLGKALDIHQNTATTYLKNIEKEWIIVSFKIGRNKLYVQPKFLNILKQS